ncbi:uncharacterized protein LOC127734131 [Mytilus californianus]|uniref:uncharacterized protein LOC127734131 n=1 Tax=Mytilus californianus TaxID=6549 RepID=UPI0022476285|nr:uncharacterized protein LOC127734131 [Mytilus californianus]
MSWNDSIPSKGKTQQLKYVKNKFGRASLVLGGYRYSAKTKRNNRIYWRCTIASCKATVNTHEGHLVKVGTPHNHPDYQTGWFKINEPPELSCDSQQSENKSMSEEFITAGQETQDESVPLHLECEEVFSVDSDDKQDQFVSSNSNCDDNSIDTQKNSISSRSHDKKLMVNVDNSISRSCDLDNSASSRLYDKKPEGNVSRLDTHMDNLLSRSHDRSHDLENSSPSRSLDLDNLESSRSNDNTSELMESPGKEEEVQQTPEFYSSVDEEHILQ